MLSSVKAISTIFNLKLKKNIPLYQILGNTAVAKESLTLHSLISSLYKNINGRLLKNMRPGLRFSKDISKLTLLFGAGTHISP